MAYSLASSVIAAAKSTVDLTGGGIYVDKPILRGKFHKYGAILYPPLLGLPLYLHALGNSGGEGGGGADLPAMSLVFNFAVESIMVVSGTLHTHPWKTHGRHELARRLDFVTIFVAIASFYSSLGKILFASDGRGEAMEPQPYPQGEGGRLFAMIEGTVWACAVVGCLAKWLFPDAPKYVNACIFLIQGWAVLPLVPTLLRSAAREEFFGLLAGGIFVTLGALSYAFQWPTLAKLVAAGGGKAEKLVTTTIESQRDVLFGPHEMFHVGTLLMFISFWYTMWMAILRKGNQWRRKR